MLSRREWLSRMGMGGQPLGSHLWGSGFLPTRHQGVQVRAAKDPVHYLGNPDGVHIHDFHTTMLHLLGIDHERLTYKFQGRRYRLTDVHGKLVKGLLA